MQHSPAGQFSPLHILKTAYNVISAVLVSLFERVRLHAVVKPVSESGCSVQPRSHCADVCLVAQAPSRHQEPTLGMSQSTIGMYCCLCSTYAAWPCWPRADLCCCCCRVDFVKEPYGPVAIDSAGSHWRGKPISGATALLFMRLKWLADPARSPGSCPSVCRLAGISTGSLHLGVGPHSQILLQAPLC